MMKSELGFCTLFQHNIFALKLGLLLKCISCTWNILSSNAFANNRVSMRNTLRKCIPAAQLVISRF
jgi:hypothetical protein